MLKIVGAAFCLAAAGCASVNYETVKQGTFRGEVAVVWLRGTGPLGDGTFVYVPTPDRPMSFTRPNGKTITPPMMYTDGGSVPGIARAFRGLTPWNYGPAYIVHDWVFLARQCMNAGETEEPYDQVAGMTFQDSAEIIAESIKTLELTKRVKASDISGAAVTFAVTSPFSLERWKAEECRVVSETDERLALEAVGRDPDVGDKSRSLILRREDGKQSRAQGVVVAVSSFE